MEYYLGVDNDRFFNHSISYNCDELINEENEHPRPTIALRDIHPVEELTCNYVSCDCEMEDFESNSTYN